MLTALQYGGVFSTLNTVLHYISVKTDFVIASPEFNPIDKLRRITV